MKHEAKVNSDGAELDVSSCNSYTGCIVVTKVDRYIMTMLTVFDPSCDV